MLPFRKSSLVPPVSASRVAHVLRRPVAIDPKLVWNYTGIAVATFIAGNVFYLCFHKRDSIEEEENLVGKDKSDSDSSLVTGDTKA